MGSFETRVLLFVLLGLCVGFAQCRTVDLPFRTGRVGVSPIDWQIQQNFCVNTANRTLLDCAFRPCCLVGPGSYTTAEKFGTRFLSSQTTNNELITYNDLYFSTEDSVLRYLYTIESMTERNAFDVTFTTTFQTPMDVVSSSSGDARLDVDDFWFITRPQNMTLQNQFLVYILGQDGRTRLQSVSTGSTNQLSWTVATGNFSQNEIQKFLYFVEVVEGTLAEAQQAVSKYTGRTIAPELLSGLTAVDFLAIQTYNVQGVSAGPIRQAYSNLCFIASEVRDRTSENRGNKKHQFEKPWFC